MQKFPIDDIKYTPSHAVVPSGLRFSVGVRAVQKLICMCMLNKMNRILRITQGTDTQSAKVT